MKFDIDVLKQYEKEGWIMSHRHKDLPLRIWNYTQLTQYESKWDDVTLNCRGTVTDTEGNVVAKGFKKFFNYEENRTTIPENLDWARIYDKLDGSYIQLFYYDDVWVVNSKGSFYSDHVNWAEEILLTKDLDNLNKTWTYCFELIHPENRIVVDYSGKKDLIFLGAFYKDVEADILKLNGFESVDSKLVTFNYQELKDFNKDNEEGYVVKFSNGERCKIKFDDYIRLHRILTEVSSYRVYEALRDGVDLNVWLEGVPDEFFSWIKVTKGKILSNYYKLMSDIHAEFSEVVKFIGIMSDKDLATYIKNTCKYPSCMFSLKNGKGIEKFVWREIKPELKYPFK